MKLPWLRGLTTCLQFIVRSSDDIEVETGEVQVGELRARAFPQLQKSLTADQVLSFGWLALADVACWPQLAPDEALALAASIEALKPALPGRALGEKSLRDAGYSAVSALLSFIAQAQARSKSPLAPEANFEIVRSAINKLVHFRHDKVFFWEQWLRRVVESAAVTNTEDACKCAVGALRGTLPAPARFEYEATRATGQSPKTTDGPFYVSVVTPRKGGSVVLALGQFIGLDPVQRQIDARLIPAVPIDRYRMAYLLRTICMAELLDDMKLGYFDQVNCTNASSGEVWTYAAT
jgi:hypothetical protein